MPDKQLGRARVVAQGLATRACADVVDAVVALGAMQGQDLPGVIASAALRTPSADPTAVTAAMDEGHLVRGYPMRGTVFLVPAADATWMGQLCGGPSVRASRARQGQIGLDDALVDRAREVAVEALAAAPRGLSRTDLLAVWDEHGVPTQGGPGYHLLSRLIAETLLYYGPWNGKDQDVVLAEGWVPAGSGLEAMFNGDRVAATAELLRRYLSSHGPATIRDFAWWTKLPLREARAALELVKGELEVGRFGVGEGPEPHYWRPGLREEVAAAGRAVAAPLLLPGFDELVLGYQDRLFAMTEQEHELLVPGRNGVFARTVVVDGAVVGLWKRGGRPSRRTFELEEFSRPSGKALPKATLARLERLFEAFPFVTC